MCHNFDKSNGRTGSNYNIQASGSKHWKIIHGSQVELSMRITSSLFVKVCHVKMQLAASSEGVAIVQPLSFDATRLLGCIT